MHRINESAACVVRLEQALCDQLRTWALAPIVQALRALPGVQLIAAITNAAELQAPRRRPAPARRGQGSSSENRPVEG